MKYRILLARHGESIWNHDSKFTGWTNIPLSKKGINEAINMSKALITNNLHPNIFFTSVLDRAIDTGNIIKNEINKDYPLHTSWRLNEKHYGTLEGIPRKYIRDVYGDLFTQMMRTNFTMKPPVLKNMALETVSSKYTIYRNCYLDSIKNGESKENVLSRLLPYYENDILYTLSEGHTPLILTHKHTARVLMKHLLKMNDEVFENYELPNKIIVVNLNNLQYESHEELDKVSITT
jgi:2,3-bisphosphoglycerate-dependent phosphoglycerate mutase